MEIPYSSNFVKNYIIFNSSVKLKTPIIQLPTGKLKKSISWHFHSNSNPFILIPNPLYFSPNIPFQCYSFSIGFAIFLELKHYKPSKRRTSIKCYSLLEQDELKPGPLALELWVAMTTYNVASIITIVTNYIYFLFSYKKPVDLTHQEVSAFTRKPLYLHVSLSFSWTTYHLELIIYYFISFDITT